MYDFKEILKLCNQFTNMEKLALAKELFGCEEEFDNYGGIVIYTGLMYNETEDDLIEAYTKTEYIEIKID